ncbi:hypothetical protein Q6A51_13235 [Pseudomonas sp. KFB-139]|uniref:Uncharacterized protein n=1 Tax=Pseudomonas serbiensis TaxID=3064350 RepID=A0ABT9CSG5_9PSED|nr:hypothetical protein [Pseudomonas sp. KFB-138]MDO7927753.1 hypothetical protein [Pseudomonas sp. KFB-138]
MPRDVVVSADIWHMLLVGNAVIAQVLQLRSVGAGNNFIASGKAAKTIKLTSAQTDYALAEHGKAWEKELKSKWTKEYRDNRALGRVDPDKGMKYIGLGKNLPSSRPRRVLEVVDATGAGVCDHLGAIAYVLCRQYLSPEYFSAWVGVESDSVMGHAFCIIGPIKTTKLLGDGKDDPSKWVVVDAWPLKPEAVKYDDHLFKADKDSGKKATMTWYMVAQGKGSKDRIPTKYRMEELLATVRLNVEKALAQKKSDDPYGVNYMCETLWDDVVYIVEAPAQKRPRDEADDDMRE